MGDFFVLVSCDGCLVIVMGQIKQEMTDCGIMLMIGELLVKDMKYDEEKGQQECDLEAGNDGLVGNLWCDLKLEAIAEGKGEEI